MPPVGATVVTKQGTGRVIGVELLAQKLVIQYEGQRQIISDVKDVLTVVSTKSQKPTLPPSENPSNEASGKEELPGNRPRRESKPRQDTRPNPRPRHNAGGSEPKERRDETSADQPPGSDLE